MECPQCHNHEISSSGTCLVCGYHVEETPSFVDAKNDELPSPTSGVPRWRKELSERLQAIKQKKEANDSAAPTATAQNSEADRQHPQPNPVIRSRKASVSPAPRILAPKQRMLEPLAETDPKKIEKDCDRNKWLDFLKLPLQAEDKHRHSIPSQHLYS